MMRDANEIAPDWIGQVDASETFADSIENWERGRHHGLLEGKEDGKASLADAKVAHALKLATTNKTMETLKSQVKAQKLELRTLKSQLKALTETPDIEGEISTNSVADELAILTELIHTNHAASMAAISEQRAHVAVNTPLPRVPSFVPPPPGQQHPPPRMQYVSVAQQQQQQARPQEWAAREQQQHQSPAQHGPQQHFCNGTGWQSEWHSQ